jgi:hypothetical protein
LIWISQCLYCIRTRVAIFQEKIIPRNRRKFWLIFPSEFLLFLGMENARNSIMEPVCGRKESSEFHSESFRRLEKHSELQKFVPNHSRIKKNTWMTFKIRGTPYRSVPTLGMGYSETYRIPRKEHFRGITKTVPRHFRWTVLSRNFDSNPNSHAVYAKKNLRCIHWIFCSL